MTDSELVRGHRLALRRLFLRPILLLVAAEVFVAFNGFGDWDDATARRGRWMMLAMAFAVVLDTHALSWIALRLAISLPSVNRVGALALAITPIGPILLTLASAPFLEMLAPRRGLGFEGTVALWTLWVTVVDLGIGQWLCRRAVLRDFREAAVRTQPRAAVAAA